MRARFFIVLASLIAALPAEAWWDGGHKMIALIAYERLSPEERSWVMQLLDGHPTRAELFDAPMRAELGQPSSDEQRTRWFFAQASIWSDLIRNRDGYPNAAEINQTYHHGSWHYTDVPVFPDEAARAALPGKAAMPALEWSPGMSEPEHGFNSVQALKRVVHELGDPVVPAAQRAVDLCWLFHLMGDFHQPCHCAELYVPGKLPEGDRGANRVLILGISRANPALQSDVLHFFWDSLWNGETNDLKSVQSRLGPLMQDETLLAKGRGGAQVVGAESLLKEGHSLAGMHVYSPMLMSRIQALQPVLNPGPGRKEEVLLVTLPTAASEIYINEARRVSRQQIVTAGMRLAAVLKQIHSSLP